MKNALIIGNLQDDSIIGELRIKKVNYDVKLLSSSVNNWEKIIEMIDDNYDFIIWKLTETALMLSCDNDYEKLFYKMLKKVALKEHIILLYEDNLRRRYNYVNKRNIEKHQLTHIININDLIDDRINYILDNDFNLFTYRFSEEIHKLVQNYISDEVDGLIMKFYIPKERLLSNELSKIIDLFQNYVNATLSVNVMINKLRTSKGMLIEFYADKKESNMIVNEWNDFPKIMDIFASDYEETKKIIAESVLPSDKKEEFCMFLNKESKRILLDLKYEVKRKQSQLTYLIENNLLEYENFQLFEDNNFKVIEKLKNGQLINSENTNIQNINYTYINNIEGNIINNEIDEQLFELIYKLGVEKEKNELISSVNSLNDDTLQHDKKVTAISKVKNFLIKNVDTIGEIGFKMLTKYIETKV